MKPFDYKGKCPHHHSLEDACQNEGTVEVTNPFDDEAVVIKVCEEHENLYYSAGWRPHGKARRR